MSPDDGRVVSNFIVQALRGEDLTFMVTVPRPVLFVMWMTWPKPFFVLWRRKPQAR